MYDRIGGYQAIAKAIRKGNFDRITPDEWGYIIYLLSKDNPKEIESTSFGGHYLVSCPNCDNKIEANGSHSHCPYCGQKLNWAWKR